MVPVAVVAAFIGVGATTATAIVVAGIVNLAINALLSFGIGKLASSLAGQPQNYANNIQTITVRNSIAPRTIVYGEVVTSGVMIFEGTSGDHNQYLWIVVALAGHEAADFGDVWLDSDNIPHADMNDTTGAVATTKFNGKLKIWKRRGVYNEAVLSDLDAASVFIDGNHIGYGVAKIIIRCEQDSVVFPNGPPNVIRVSVKGKCVYDPRKDSTNGGSGSHRLTDATTWEWSANPALCTADYFWGGSIFYGSANPLSVLGVGLTTDRINWAYVSAAANTCDETVTIPTGTQVRYSLGLVLSCGDIHDTNINKLLAAMIGQRIWVAGQYRIYAGAYDTPSASLTDDDLTVDGYSLQGASAQKDVYNQVGASYFDPARDWQNEPCAVRQEDSYIAEDGLPVLRNIVLDGVTDEYRAQRICEVILRQSRNQVSPILNCKLSADLVAPWETFYLSIAEQGWVNKVFRAKGLSVDLGQRRVQITCTEESETAYEDLESADYAAPGTAAPTNTIERPSPPSNLTARGLQDGIVFTWDPSSYFPVGANYELYEKTTVSPFSSATLIAKSMSVTSLIIYKGDTTTRYYWILARSPQGLASDPFPAGNGVSGAASSNSPAFSVTPSPSSINDIDTTASITTGSTTASTTNGVSPFTFAWSWDSGGTGITITSASSASTTFSVTGMSLNETRTGQAKCTVTDNTSVVRTCTVSVSITRASTTLTAVASPTSIFASAHGAGSITTGTVTVTASAGTPTYSYAWTWLSGGTGITINSPSSNVTTFTGASGGGDTKTGTARCTVTDSASGTKTVDVSVTTSRITA